MDYQTTQILFFQCVKSKSVTNLAEATADPAIDLAPTATGDGELAAAPQPQQLLLQQQQQQENEAEPLVNQEAPA
jgi:hypothetical protein